MKRSIWADGISFFFIVLFLYTGAVKLIDIRGSQSELAASPLIGAFAAVVAWALPIAELFLAIVLFIPRWRLKGLYSTAIVMTAFTGYVLTILIIDDGISCSCGGIIESLTPKEHLIFNTCCVILSVLGILLLRRQTPTSAFRWLTRTSTIGCCAAIGWILFTAFTAPAIQKTGQEGKLLPSFDLLLPDSTSHFNTAEIPTGRSFVMIGFSPTCRHCQDQITAITQHIAEFKNARIYYVTSAKFSLVKAFYRHFKLEQYPNIVIGRDSANKFFTYFNTPGTPFTTIYDSKKRLKWAMQSEPNVARISQLLEE